MTEASKFADLTTRILSAIVILGLAVGSILGVPIWFVVFCAILGGASVWEVCTFSKVNKLAVIPVGFFGALLVCALYFEFTVSVFGFSLILLVLYWLYAMQEDALLRLCYIAAIILGCWGILQWRQDGGDVLLFWMILCVVASDIGGYFFGRILGGPKLWPAVSPKKTWSGTIGGWLLAVLFSVPGFHYYDISFWFLPFAIAIAIAAQAGDLFESWIKRRAGIKDSSNLIPGHGGVLDRFDGFIGAGLLVLLIDQFKFIWSA